MVRVITVHNFLGQRITQIEEPTASCIANSAGREMLLLALSTHCIEAWELSVSDLKLLTAFPTVDTVQEVIHCAKGDYVATLESKCPRDVSNNQVNKAGSNFVRIYVNWAMAKNQNQPMRARIAGWVTPSLNRPLNTLEMIELPLTVQPTLIACCQRTGNLLAATANGAILHEFKVETQQMSKLKFIDFEARPWSLGFSFAPTFMQIIEDFILIMNSTNIHVFRLTNFMYEDIDQLSSLTSEKSMSEDKNIATAVTVLNENPNRTDQESDYIISKPNDAEKCNSKRTDKGNKCFDAQKFDKTKKRIYNEECCIDIDKLSYNEKEEMDRLVARGIVDKTSQPFTVVLPSISIERACPGHTLSPFILNPPGMKVFIKTNSPDVGWSENYSVMDLLRLQISSNKGNQKFDECNEHFTNSLLKPLYMKRECNAQCSKRSILRSSQYKYLQGVSCFVCTAQEGYFYHFPTTCLEPVDATCLTTYPFTAPVNSIALEHTAIHALTEVGLESYTVRLSHHIMKTFEANSAHNVCPNVSEPVCLIGLRPFLGIQKLLQAKNYLVLLANAEQSWTLYSLILPKFDNLYFDILTAAKSYKSTSPSTYRHLLTEAHAVLRLAKEIYSGTNDNNDESYESAKKEEHKLVNLYNQSCALLADYYISSMYEPDWDLCIPYYKMSGLKPSEILSRKSSRNAPGLLTFLTDTLLTMRNGIEADAFFQGQNIVELILQLEKKQLMKLIFGSSVLREYTTEKLISRLLSFEQDDEVRLALALLYIQADREDQAEEVLQPVPSQCIRKILLHHWNLLLDLTAVKKQSPMISGFSDFAGLLMRCKSTIFADILVRFARNGSPISLDRIIQMFLEYLPSRVGRDGHVAASTLQLFLEDYLQELLGTTNIKKPIAQRSQIPSEYTIAEAFKILIRTYLGKLTQRKVYNVGYKEDEGSSGESLKKFRFVKFRPQYLNKMPPYAKDFQKVLNAKNTTDHSALNNLLAPSSNEDIPKELIKLQSLLACEFVLPDCLQEVRQFLETQNIEGGLSLQTLCIKDTVEVTKILMDNCPQSVLHYAKEKYSNDSEWMYFMELLQAKILTTATKPELSCLYNQIMKETLDYLPSKLSLENLRRILPKEENDDISQKYIEMYNRAKHADYVQSLIMETGQQLLSTLKL